jgi:ferric-dicitrate binding protein FerR (iron transport regulator)
MLKQEEVEKIERYINGLSDDSEKTYIESLFSKGENNSLLRHHLEKDWDMMLRETTSTEVNLNYLLDHVHHIIRKNETLKRQKPFQKFIRIYMRAAAILLLPLLIAAGLVYSYLGNRGKSTTDRQVISTIYAPLGARISFNLPDGTTGMLNSGSHLSYSLPFTSNRQVKLDGEAWLEVSPDKDHPFEISTGNSTVKVLGTSFNVSAYPAENYVEVVLQQGKVEFQDNKGGEKVTMIPSERLVFQNGNISKVVTDPAKYNAWTEGKLVFRGDPMAEVARRIERWYNVRIKIADKELEKYSFRATFQDDNLEDVLRFISMTSPIRYEITPRELMQDGTYKKEEVTIYLKK